MHRIGRERSRQHSTAVEGSRGGRLKRIGRNIGLMILQRVALPSDLLSVNITSRSAVEGL